MQNSSLLALIDNLLSFIIVHGSQTQPWLSNILTLQVFGASKTFEDILY